jgi:hypothetical protein
MNIKPEMADSQLPDRLDRRNAQARHDRWALEMDRALFAAAPAPVRQPGLFAWQSASESPTPARAVAHDAVRGAAPGQAGSAPAPGADRDTPHRPDDDAGVTDASPAAAVTPFAAAPAAAPATTPDGVQPSSAPVAAGPAAQAMRTAGTAQPQAMSAPAALPQTGSAGAVATPGMPPPGMDVTGAASPQTMVAAAAAAAAANAMAPAEDAAVPDAAAHARVLPAAGGAALFAPLPEESASRAGVPGEDEGGAETRTGAEPTAESGEDYAERLLHLYEHDGDVQAWIRDAQLQPAQARAVAQALAMQLSVQGTRLAALTINGRDVELSAEPGRAQPATGLFEHRFTDAAAAASPDQGDSPA